MSQAGLASMNGGGGSAIQTIDGDTGSITGSTVTIYADNAANNCGSSVEFVNSGTVSTLNVTDVGQNTFIGQNSGNLALSVGDATTNCALGYDALGSVITADGCCAMGFAALGSCTQGTGAVAIGQNALASYDDNNSIAIGFGAMEFATSGTANVSIGYSSLVSLLTGSYNVAIGPEAGVNLSGAESDNIYLTNFGVASENNTIRIGTQGNGNRQQNRAFMAGIVGVTTSNSEYVTINSSTGQLGASASGLGITINGDSGSISGSTLTVYADNTANNSGASVAFVNSGTVSTLNLTDANSSIFLGNSCGNSTFSGTANTACGVAALEFGTGTENCAFGYLSLQNNTNSANCAFGSRTIGGAGAGTGNCCFGQSSGGDIASGSYNNSYGYGALTVLVNGNYNVGIGTNAGVSYASTESSNIVISNDGVLGESNTLRIGTTGTGDNQVSTCYIAGISGVTVGGSGVPVEVDTNGQLGTVVSSRRFKEDISTLTQSDVLKLNPVSFTYKNDKEKTPHVGLIAEEVNEILPQLVVRDREGEIETVRYQELAIYMLDEMKRMSEKISVLECKLSKCCEGKCA